MDNELTREPMLEIYITETSQMLERLEQCILDAENSGMEQFIDEIFRIMHSLKGSSSMMLFDNIARLAHSLEDLFDYFRSEKPQKIDYSDVTDIVLNCIDFFKSEVSKLNGGSEPDGSSDDFISNVKKYLGELKCANGSNAAENTEELPVSQSSNQKYYIASTNLSGNALAGNSFKATVFFLDDCGAENLRAFTLTHGLKDLVSEMQTFPEQIIGNNESIEIIKNEGLQIFFTTNTDEDEIKKFLNKDPFVKQVEFEKTDFERISSKEVGKREIILDEQEMRQALKQELKGPGIEKTASSAAKQSTINVNITKLDTLMDLVGELVIAEAMVTQNPDLDGLQLDGFFKAARHLRKISGELQDSVMSIRMVPLAMTFQKMHRLVRDMCHKLDKDVQLEIIGEETEVDKSIIESISDPIMHLIRNSMDHGLETAKERVASGKPAKGKITLEAKNAGGEVWIIIKDDGRGLNKEKILKKAAQNGLLTKPEDDMSDKEIYSLIFLPGFSTKEAVSEFSGRGVGMDVVMKNIEKSRGTVGIESVPGQGSTVYIKIPLTLAIIDGMTIRVGGSRYTLPIGSIKESFKVGDEDVVTDPDGNELLLVRGECYPIIRLHDLYKVDTDITNISEGIITMIEDEEKSTCLFADALLGQQQVVVKPLPKYIKKVKGVAGCTLLGDGSVSLILDTASLINIQRKED